MFANKLHYGRMCVHTYICTQTHAAVHTGACSISTLTHTDARTYINNTIFIATHKMAIVQIFTIQ